ncbi:MAG: aspartate-semialdehyde dehydrogenase [Planctomycetota bacterium]|nr:MAG: aspartate-semialdehyde dehydrogenase [Planctomycetota bacterium]
MSKTYRVAIVGATGAVGLKFIECIEQRKFPCSEVVLFASTKSEGKVLHVNGKPCRIVGLTPEKVDKFDFAFFSAGSGISKEYAPLFAKKGAVVIDNSSAWRMDPSVPLVVPEVNPGDIWKHQGIIANPNCSTIQMVVALKPIHDASKIKRVVVSTYQAISGAGGLALQEFENEVHAMEMKTTPPKRGIFPRQIAFNAIAQIPQKDAFLANGYTTEETKMIEETKKIMGDPNIRVSPTCVRIPVKNSHSESVNIETEKKITPAEAVALLKKAPGIVVCEKQEDFPTPAEVSGRGETFVGRIREDWTVPNGLHMWVVADNILKGAALNAVQIAEVIIKK